MIGPTSVFEACSIDLETRCSRISTQARNNHPKVNGKRQVNKSLGVDASVLLLEVTRERAVALSGQWRIGIQAVGHPSALLHLRPVFTRRLVVRVYD